MKRAQKQQFIYLLTALVLLSSLAFPAAAQDYSIDRNELESVNAQDIEFINYVGPHEPSALSTAEEITDIGRAVSRSDNYNGLYRIIRASDPDTPEGLDADIFIIEEKARVDHIRNVRAMLSGYLQQEYAMDAGKAETIAFFVTIYNAVYRGKMSELGSRYKPVVMNNLAADNAGIALNYREWAGKTRMLIPIRSAAQQGEREPVDTSEISDDAVIEEMKQEEDRAVEERKEMVEIREEEIDREQEAIDEEVAAIEEEKAEVQEMKEEQAAQEQAEEETGIETPPEEKITDEQIEEKEEEIEQREEKVEERQQQVEEETQEVREERREIASDENEVIEEQKAEEKAARQAQIQNPEVKPFFFLSLREEATDVLGQIVMADENSGKILFESDVNSIRGREFLIAPDGILVIAGRNDGGGLVRAMVLDSETLQVVLEGTHDVHPQSGLWQSGGQYYMVIKDETGNWVMARFNNSLELQRQGTEAVQPYTAAVFDNDGLYVQGPTGSIIKLDPSTLEKQSSID